MKARCGRREMTRKVFKDRRSPRRRGRMGTSVRNAHVEVGIHRHDDASALQPPNDARESTVHALADIKPRDVDVRRVQRVRVAAVREELIHRRRARRAGRRDERALRLRARRDRHARRRRVVVQRRDRFGRVAELALVRERARQDARRAVLPDRRAQLRVDALLREVPRGVERAAAGGERDRGRGDVRAGGGERVERA